VEKAFREKGGKMGRLLEQLLNNVKAPRFTERTLIKYRKRLLHLKLFFATLYSVVEIVYIINRLNSADPEYVLTVLHDCLISRQRLIGPITLFGSHSDDRIVRIVVDVVIEKDVVVPVVLVKKISYKSDSGTLSERRGAERRK